MRAECLDWTLIQRSAASRSNPPDLRRALQPRAAPSRPRPRLTAGRSLGSGPGPGQHARCSPAGPARWTHPRVLRRRRVIESGFPTPTGSEGAGQLRATGGPRQLRLVRHGDGSGRRRLVARWAHCHRRDDGRPRFVQRHGIPRGGLHRLSGHSDRFRLDGVRHRRHDRPGPSLRLAGTEPLTPDPPTALRDSRSGTAEQVPFRTGMMALRSAHRPTQRST